MAKSMGAPARADEAPCHPDEMPAASTLPPRSGGEGRFALRQQGEPGSGAGSEIEKTAGADAPLPPTPDPPSLRFGGQDPSPPLTAFAGGGEKNSAPADLPLAGRRTTRRSPRKVEIGDEVKADWKRRYETTDESVVAIAAASGFEETLVRRTAKKEGWVRYKRPPLGLSPAAKLAGQAERLAAFASRRDASAIEKTAGADAPGTPTRAASPSDLPLAGGGEEEALAALAGGAEKAAATFDGDIKAAAREIIAAIRAQIAEIEALRAGLKTTGRRPTQASRAAHDIAMLSGAIQRLQPISNGLSSPVNDDDDAPYEDLDELRRRVAAKIQAFLDRRPDIGVTPGREAEGAEEDRA